MLGNKAVIEKLEELKELLKNNDVTEPEKLKSEISRLTEQLKQLKSDKKIEEREIQHLVKLKEEKLLVDYEKKVMELERKKASEVQVLRDEYQEKLQKLLERRGDDLKDMYAQILARLPDINLHMKGKV